MDAVTELQPGEPGRGGLVDGRVPGAGAWPEDLLQEAVQGEHRGEIYRLGEAAHLIGGKRPAGQASEQLGRRRLPRPGVALELQATG